MPTPTLRTVFREKFLAGLRQPYRKDMLDLTGPAAAFRDHPSFEQLMEKLGKKNWFVYAKPPFGGAEHVLRYLGRYTHRMAISNHRLTAFDGEHVSFRWRDYAHRSKQRVMPLDAVEFLHRFFLHVLPKGFVRIRHYGLLSNRFRKQLLPPWRAHSSPPRATSHSLCRPCPTANSGTAPVAAHPCASPSASPPHNSIWQASIPHDHRYQPGLWTAPGMPSHSCVQPPCQRWLCAVSRALGSFDLRQLYQGSDQLPSSSLPIKAF